MEDNTLPYNITKLTISLYGGSYITLQYHLLELYIYHLALFTKGLVERINE